METNHQDIQKHFFKYEFFALKEIILALFVTLAIYSVYAGIVHGAALAVSPAVLLTFFNFFFFRLIYSILDRDNFDESIDKFLIATLWVWIPANYVFSQSAFIFSLVLLLLYLKSQNFLLGQLIRVNPFLRIILNSNFAFVFSFYILTVFMVDQYIFILNDRAILLAFGLWLTYLAYKLSTSMRGELIDLKEDFVSAQLGIIKSSTLILILLLGQLGVFVFLARGMIFQKELTLGLVTLFVLLFFIYVIYILKGREKDAKALAPTTLSYGILSLFIICVGALLEYLV